MVHALEEVGRVVCPPGADAASQLPIRRGVLDVRPTGGDPTIVIRRPDGVEVVCGRMPRKSGEADRHGAARRAVTTVVERGLFRLIAERQFTWVDEYDSVDELVEDVEDSWATRVLDESVALALVQAFDAAGGVPLIRHEVDVRVLVRRGAS